MILPFVHMQLVLGNTAVLAGDYDACISGVYGDTSSSESSREIIPLLKQLINMLEKGVNFTLSADLLQEMAGFGPGGDTVNIKVWDMELNLGGTSSLMGVSGIPIIYV